MYRGSAGAQYTRKRNNISFKNGIESNTNQPQPLRGSTRPPVPNGARREGRSYRSRPIQEPRWTLFQD